MKKERTWIEKIQNQFRISKQKNRNLITQRVNQKDKNEREKKKQKRTKKEKQKQASIGWGHGIRTLDLGAKVHTATTAPNALLSMSSHMLM